MVDRQGVPCSYVLSWVLFQTLCTTVYLRVNVGAPREVKEESKHQTNRNASKKCLRHLRRNSVRCIISAAELRATTEFIQQEQHIRITLTEGTPREWQSRIR